MGLAAIGVMALGCTSDRADRTESDVRAVTAAVTWASAMPLRYVRDGNTVTLLGDGTLLIAGGAAANGRSTEIIDPYRSTVTDGPPMTTARTRHAAVMLESGKVLVVGGGTASAELYDPLARTFTPTGSMGIARTGQAAVRMRSGKVLVAGGAVDASAEIYDPASGSFTATPLRKTTGGGRGSLVSIAHSDKLFFTTGAATAAPTYEIFDPAGGGGAGAWSAWTGPAFPDTDAGYDVLLTGLPDGGIVSGHVHLCGTLCDGTKTALVDPAPGGGPQTFVRSPLPFFSGGPADGKPCTAIGPSVALLGDGSVVYASWWNADPGTFLSTRLTILGNVPSCTSDPSRTAPTPHALASMVLLPGGSAILVGGIEATADVRVSGVEVSDAFGIRAKTPRMNHAAARMHDGRILLVGGRNGPDDTAQTQLATTASVESFDDVANQFATGDGVTVLDTMTVPRYAHTATALASGQVLITGGAQTDPGDPTRLAVVHRSAEIYDPAAPPGRRTRAVGDMSIARMDHAATLLPSGKVLVSGGCAARAGVADVCATTTASAELFDPSTEQFTGVGSMTEPRTAHGGALLPTGNVLVVGGGDGSAELFDPTSRLFRPTRSSGAVRDGRTARTLPDGRIFLDGGPTRNPEIFDATTETWSFGAILPSLSIESRWGTRPSGQLVQFGVRPTKPNGVASVFDPLGSRSGTVDEIQLFGGRYGATVTTGRTGDPIALGGSSESETFVGANWPKRHPDGAAAAARPVLDPLPARVMAGTVVPITGHGFTERPEGSNGTASSSATNHPVVTWLSDAGDAVVAGTIVSFTDTTANWLVPATTYHGHGLLFVWSGGVGSLGQSVSIDPAPGATSCRNDPECGTGFCVDGVCCDRRCDAKCEGCSAKRKTQGDDGVCGPVPPGHDIAGRCFSSPGAACATGDECGTGFCAQGVCCDSTCTGSCQACNLRATLGVCSAVQEGACNGTCVSVKDCAAPLVCGLDGHCTAQPEPTAASGTVCGCRVVGGRNDRTGAAACAALAALALVRRRRR